MESSRLSRPLTLRLRGADGASLPLGAALQYGAADPLAVVALFDTGEGAPVQWVFARDLLIEGLTRRCGDGDVVVWPTMGADGSATIHLRLTSPHGGALIEADASAIRDFIDGTRRLVPVGGEDELLDVDAVVDAILGGA